MIQITSLETRTGKSLQNTDNQTNNTLNQANANVITNSKTIVQCLNELKQSLSTDCHFSESKSAMHKYKQLYMTS